MAVAQRYSVNDASFGMGVCTAPPLGFLCRQGGISGGFDVAYIAKAPRFVQSNLDIASKIPVLSRFYVVRRVGDSGTWYLPSGGIGIAKENS